MYDPRASGAKCDRCPLNQCRPVPGTAPYPSFLLTTSPEDTVAIVGEAPGEEEERQGRPFCGPSGDELDKGLLQSGIARGHAYVLNVLACRPPENKLKTIIAKINKHKKQDPDYPFDSPIECCKPRFYKEASGARNFVALGGTAYQALTGSSAGIMGMRGDKVESDSKECTGCGRLVVKSSHCTVCSANGTPYELKPATLRIVPTVHPAFVLRQQRWRHVYNSDLRKASRWFRGVSTWVDPKRVMQPTPSELREFLSRYKKYAYDLETDGIEPLTAQIRCIGIGTSDEVHVVSLLSKDGFTRFYEPAVEEEIVGVIKEFLLDRTVVKIGHNAGSYDRLVVESQWGITPKPLLDTILLHKSVESELPHNLGYVGLLYTDVHAWKSDRDGNKLSVHAETDYALAHYCGTDVVVTYRVHEPLIEQVRLRDQMSVCGVDHKMQEVCVSMKRCGMYVDQAARLKEEKSMLKKRHTYLDTIRKMCDRPTFNPGSVHQMRDLLFDKWKLVPQLDDEEERLTGSGDPSTSDLILRALLTDPRVPKDKREFIKQVRLYRKMMKLLGTYVVKMRPNNIETINDLQWQNEDDDEWDEDFDFENSEEYKHLDKDTRKRYGADRAGITSPILYDAYGNMVAGSGRMYPGYGAHIAVTGRLSSSKPINCFDGDTEILTTEGWHKFRDLPEGIPVAQWHDDGSINFAVPTAYHRGVYTGGMYNFRSQSSDILATSNHRVPIKSNNGVLKTKTMEELLSIKHGYHTIHAGFSTHGKGVPLTAGEIKLLIAFQADGYWAKADGKTYGICFGLTRPRKQERLRMLLAEAGLSFSEHDRLDQVSATGQPTRFYVPFSENAMLEALLNKFLGEKKLWSSWLLDMSATQRRTFIDELWLWDGSSTTLTDYATKIKSNADWVQAVIALSGIRANCRYYTNSEGHSVWIVSIRNTTTNAITAKAEREIVLWNDYVYCVTVPSDAIVTRRNGKVTITRQSQNVPKALRKLVTAAPGNVLVGADMNQLELRIAAALWGVQIYLRAFAEGKDPHSMTAFAVFGEGFCKHAGIDPAQFDRPGKLIGKSWDEFGAFDDSFSDEARQMRTLAKSIQFASQYMASVETVHKLVVKNEIPAIDPITKKPLEDGTTDLPYALMPLSKVRQMRENWLEKAPEFEAGWAKEIDEFRLLGYLREPVGGRRRDFMDGEDANAIVNFKVQCIRGDMRVLTSIGLVPVATLGGKQFSAWTGHAWAPAVAVHKGQAEIFKVTTKCGLTLLCDKTHGFLAVGTDKYEWRAIEAQADRGTLSVGDRIAVAMAEPMEFGDDYNPEEMWALGYWVGNGGSDKRQGRTGVNWTIGKGREGTRNGEFILQRLKNFCTLMSWAVYVEECDGHWRLYATFNPETSDVSPTDWLRGHLEDLHVTAQTKRVPQTVFRGSLSSRVRFLQGYLDADGSYDERQGRVFANACQLPLMEDICLIARSVGVAVNSIFGPYAADRAGHTAYRIGLNADLCEIHLSWGQGGRLRTKEESSIPKFAFPGILAQKLSYTQPSDKVLKSRMKKAVEHNKDVNFSPYVFQRMGAEGLYDHVEIASIETTGIREDVYTLSVDDPLHQYVAEHFIAKNSGAAGLMNKALIEIHEEIPLWKWGPGTGVINQCHDAIVVECPEKEAEWVAGVLERCMNQTHPNLPGVAFTAKPKIGKTWKEVG